MKAGKELERPIEAPGAESAPDPIAEISKSTHPETFMLENLEKIQQIYQGQIDQAREQLRMWQGNLDQAQGRLDAIVALKDHAYPVEDVPLLTVVEPTPAPA